MVWKWEFIVQAFDFEPAKGEICMALPINRSVKQTIVTRKRELAQQSKKRKRAEAAADSNSDSDGDAMDEDKLAVPLVADELAPAPASRAPPPAPAPAPMLDGECCLCGANFARHETREGLKCVECEHLISVHCLEHFGARIRKALGSRRMPWRCEACAVRLAEEQRRAKRVVQQGENSSKKRT